MADLSFEDQLKFRRSQMAYTDLGTSVAESTKSTLSKASVDTIPPPPPMPPSINYKVDLRPIDMQDGNKGWKPHVNAVVHPKNREVKPSNPSAEEIQAQIKKMRSNKKGKNVLEDDEPSHRMSEPLTPPSSPSDTRKSQMTPNSMRREPKLSEPQSGNHRSASQNVKTNSNDALEQKIAKLEQMLLNQKMETQTILSDRLKRYVESNTGKSADDYSEVNVPTCSSIPDIPPVNVKTDIRPMDSASAISSPSRSDDGKSIRSEATAKSGILRHKRSRSISFSLENDEEDDRSVISKDDIVDIEQGADDDLGTLCEKFSVSGPYNDDELNLVHAICSEYTAAARMTLARRSFFSRKSAHYVRVYSYLASNRRSKWLNTSDWTSGMTQTKILDYLFRKTLRSRTLKINMPLMQLDGLDQGRTLTEHRFKKIIKTLFTKRDELVLSIVGATPKFESIA